MPQFSNNRGTHIRERGRCRTLVVPTDYFYKDEVQLSLRITLRADKGLEENYLKISIQNKNYYLIVLAAVSDATCSRLNENNFTLEVSSLLVSPLPAGLQRRKRKIDCFVSLFLKKRFHRGALGPISPTVIEGVNLMYA